MALPPHEGFETSLSTPTTLFINNHGAQLLMKNPINHNKMKHIDVHHHFICQCMEDGSITLCSVPSTDNVANICTKPLGKIKISFLCFMLGVGCLDRHPEQDDALKSHTTHPHTPPRHT